jgi:predicted porin
MKKNMIALAVATAFAAPAVMAEATLYGLANLSISQSSGDTSSEELNIASTASRFGIKGSNDLGDGLKAIYQAEFQMDVAGSGTDTVSNRNQFAGLAGGFGTVMLGNMDSPMKSAMGKIDMFADTVGDMTTGKIETDTSYINETQFVSASVTGEDRNANSLTYVSPKFEGVQVALQMSGAKGKVESGDAPKSFSVSYTGVEGLLVAYSMDDNVLVETDDGDEYTGNRKAITVQYKMDDMTFGLIHQKTEYDGYSDGYDVKLVNASYKMDKTNLKVQLASGDYFGLDSFSYSAGADYDFNKNTKAYALYNKEGINESGYKEDISTFQVGILTKF